MKLLTDTELKNTRQKLAELEALFKQTQQEPCDDPELRDMELESLSRLANMLREEIIRSEAYRIAS
jgi:hypothetical protein